jgi:ribosomal-protein-alanine N-acetyltransferase
MLDIQLPQSQRLIFRHLQPGDAVIWEAFLSNAEAVKFFPPGLNVTQSAVEWIERQLKRYKADGFGLNALIEKVSGAFIGQCGLLRQEVDGIQELEIGYHLLPRFWKKGFAAEAANSCRTFAFENRMAASVISIIDPQNLASQRVAVRNGMKKDKETVWHGAAVFIYRVRTSGSISTLSVERVPSGGPQNGPGSRLFS